MSWMVVITSLTMLAHQSQSALGRVHFIRIINGEAVCTCREKGNCTSPGKHPLVKWKDQATRDHYKIEEIWDRMPGRTNIQIVLRDGLFVIDLDHISFEAFVGKFGKIPETVMARSGRKDAVGCHIYLRAPEGFVVREGGYIDGVDIKSAGKGLIVAPPSLHASGQRYAWIKAPWDVPIADAPERILELVRAPERVESEIETGVGGKHDSLVILGSLLTNKGFSPEEIEPILYTHQKTLGKRTNDVPDILGWLKPGPIETRYDSTSQGWADLLVDLPTWRYKFVPEQNAWFEFDGIIWRSLGSTNPFRTLMSEAACLYQLRLNELLESLADNQREAMDDENARRRLSADERAKVKRAVGVRSRVQEGRSWEDVFGIGKALEYTQKVSITEFDQQPTLLACQNGVVNLLTGECCGLI